MEAKGRAAAAGVGGILKISVRSVLADRRRTLLIGLSLFVSLSLLLFFDAVGNGAGGQLLHAHKVMQSADVVAIWRNVLDDVDPADPGRLLFSEPDGKTRTGNNEAVAALDAFLAENAARVSTVYRPVRAFGMLDTGSLAAYSMLDGVEPDELEFLTSERSLALIEGEPLFDTHYGVYVSYETALKNGIWVGDYVSLDGTTASGLVNTMDFQVAGVYMNGAPWDNITVFMRADDARELLEWDPSWFGSVRIYLKNPAERARFAADLDARLTAAGGELRAEPSDTSTRFWQTFSGFLKALFTVFTVFLLLIITIGVRSTVRMSLFLRIQEFGTLRAIGFTRVTCMAIVLLETLIVSLLALGAAAAVAGGLAAFFSWAGLYVGAGPAAYVLGGEVVYPRLLMRDVLTALSLTIAFSLLAPLGPGLKLLAQRITDMLARRQRRLSALKTLILGGAK